MRSSRTPPIVGTPVPSAGRVAGPRALRARLRRSGRTMVGMDSPFGPIDPEAFADTPLFREIQRVLTSSSGPINWELARQIGIAGAQEGRDDPIPSEDDQRTFEEAVRVAELQVARFTGLDTPSDGA